MKTIYNSDSLMIDLETLGNKPGSVIVQIGAVTFNKAGIEKEFVANVSYDYTSWNRYKTDLSTIKWWMEQDKAIINSVFNAKVKWSLCRSLIELSSLKADFFWAKSTSFDFGLLENAFNIEDVKSSIDFRNIVDVRDIYNLNPGYHKHRGALNKHNALEDAIDQAKYVVEWMNS